MAEAPEVSLGVRCFGCKAPLAAEPLGPILGKEGTSPGFLHFLGLCAQQGVSLAGESPAAPSQGGCVDKRPGISRRPRVARCEEGRVSIARWNPKGMRRTSGP